MALVVAILVSTVFIAIGALVINVGGWFAARAMNQNAADAAAVAVADSCATTCQPSVANSYADGSSNGGLADQIDSRTPCGTFPGLMACASGLEDGRKCPVANPTYPYVDVLVTPNTGGSGQMVNLFGGGSQKIGQCAQAAISAPSSCSACAAITISSQCWTDDTNTGGSFPTPPAGGTYALTGGITTPPSYIDSLSGTNSVGDEVVLVLKGSPAAGSNSSCNQHSYASGNTGWLSNSSCSASISGTSYQGVSGNSSAPCYDTFNTSRTEATPIYLPVFSSVRLSGSNTVYQLDGYAAFVVTGWNITSGSGTFGGTKNVGSILATTEGYNSSAADYCSKYKSQLGSNGAQCIYGYFTKALIPPGQLGGGGGTNLGLQQVFLTG